MLNAGSRNVPQKRSLPQPASRWDDAPIHVSCTISAAALTTAASTYPGQYKSEPWFLLLLTTHLPLIFVEALIQHPTTHPKSQSQTSLPQNAAISPTRAPAPTASTAGSLHVPGLIARPSPGEQVQRSTQTRNHRQPYRRNRLHGCDATTLAGGQRCTVACESPPHPCSIFRASTEADAFTTRRQ